MTTTFLQHAIYLISNSKETFGVEGKVLFRHFPAFRFQHFLQTFRGEFNVKSVTSGWIRAESVVK